MSTANNICGVPGVGQKTGSALLAVYPDYAAVMRGISEGEVSERSAQKVAEFCDVEINRQVLKLRLDAEIDVESLRAPVPQILLETPEIEI